jgi:hypothetical protein
MFLLLCLLTFIFIDPISSLNGCGPGEVNVALVGKNNALVSFLF